MRKGKTFIICGPSGVGKGTVVARLLASDPTLYFSVSATTRPPRAGEEDGVHYHFLDRETFEQWIAAGDFLEYAEYVGNLYGTPRLYVDRAMEQGRDVLLDIEIQGAEQVRQKRPETVRIYVAPPSCADPSGWSTSSPCRRRSCRLPRPPRSAPPGSPASLRRSPRPGGRTRAYCSC